MVVTIEVNIFILQKSTHSYVAKKDVHSFAQSTKTKMKMVFVPLAGGARLQPSKKKSVMNLRKI